MQDIATGAARFFWDENGAIAVDLVILTAAIASLGLAMLAVVSGAVDDRTAESSNALMEVDPDNPITGDQAALQTSRVDDSAGNGSYRQGWVDTTSAARGDVAQQTPEPLATRHRATADSIPAASGPRNSRNVTGFAGEPEITIAAQANNNPDTRTRDAETGEVHHTTL